MATSGSINYTQTAADVVKDSLVLIGVAHPEETLNSATQNYALDALNKMIKSWGAQGAKLWALEQAACIFDNDVVAYTFHGKSATGGKVAAGVKVSGLVQTTFSADEAASQTILSVTSSTGMSASDKVIIELDTGNRHETTIATVDSSTQITVDDALATAAASGNFIYTYTLLTDEINYPAQIHNVRLRNSSGNEIPIEGYSRNEYLRIVDKDQEGSPYVYYFDKQLSNPVIYVWPEPDNLKEQLRFDYLKTIEDIDATTDNMYFPDEWLEALTYNLAVRLAPAYGKELKMQALASMASIFFDDAMRADEEDVSTNFMPEIR